MKNSRMTHELLEMLQKSNKNAPSLSQRLTDDPQRFERFSRHNGGLLLDFSRSRIDEAALDGLLKLAETAGVTAAREQMFAGGILNNTEQRPVLHHAWRSRQFGTVLDTAEAARCTAALQRMNALAADLHRGILPADPASGPGRIKHIVHVGIGGSLLGPRLLCEAYPADAPTPEVHFISSVDALERERLLARIAPQETVIVLVSKSFTTSEVLAHARRLRSWQSDALSEPEQTQRLFAVTAAADKAIAFGVPQEQVMDMGEWTGGRFSLWSPVGLTAAIRMGPGAFDRLCAGGAAMDTHFRDTPLRDNLPVLHGLLSVWHRNVCGYACRGVIPYDARLKSFPGWLQQLQMESNGKSVDRQGQPVALATSPVVLGECGTDAQHALFQAFHQGTEIVPLDFIGVVRADHDDVNAQTELLSHLLAQASALALGRDENEVRDRMLAQGQPSGQIDTLAVHRVMPGNRPSNIVLLDALTPEALGALLVLYEHSILVESVIWNINAFDQWGVELGKEMATSIAPELADASGQTHSGISGLDGLIHYIRERAAST